MPRGHTFATIILTASILIPFISANPFHLPGQDLHHINHVEKVTAKSNANPHANNLGNANNGIGTTIGGIANAANNIVNSIANALKPNNENYTEYPPPALAQEFIMAHNQIRKAENVPPLVWNDTLAQFAETWAMKQTDCGMRHSEGHYGENLFWGLKAHWLPREAVEDWAREKQFYNREKRQCAQDKTCGHYTQIVWKTTQQVGCTRFRCSNGSLLIICEYAPPGNYVNEDPFNPGSLLSPPPPPTPSTTPPSSSPPPLSSPPPPTPPSPSPPPPTPPSPSPPPPTPPSPSPPPPTPPSSSHASTSPPSSPPPPPPTPPPSSHASTSPPSSPSPPQSSPPPHSQPASPPRQKGHHGPGQGHHVPRDHQRKGGGHHGKGGSHHGKGGSHHGKGGGHHGKGGGHHGKGSSHQSQGNQGLINGHHGPGRGHHRNPHPAPPPLVTQSQSIQH